MEGGIGKGREEPQANFAIVSNDMMSSSREQLITVVLLMDGTCHARWIFFAYQC